MKTKILRITTVPISLKVLLKGQHRFLRENGFDVIGVSGDGDYLEAVAADEKIQTVAVNMTRSLSPLKDFKSLLDFYILCKREKPVIVHSHTPKAGIIGMLGAKLARVPIRLHTVAGLPLTETTGFKRIVLDMVERLTYACSTMIYPNSRGVYDYIVRNKYASMTKLKVLGQGSSNGIDTSFFNPDQYPATLNADLRERLGILPNDFVYIYVGRLVGDKGINELVTAFSLLIGSEIGVGKLKLVLVGSFESELDPLEKSTVQVIEDNQNILHLGFEDDVRPYLAISDCLVFPSYREGFPNVVMQAGAMGLPSIVTDINGCNEIILGGENGLIVPVKDFRAIYEAMKKLFTDQCLYLKLKKNARPMIKSRYEQFWVWQALLEEYRRVLTKKGYETP